MEYNNMNYEARSSQTVFEEDEENLDLVNDVTDEKETDISKLIQSIDSIEDEDDEITQSPEIDLYDSIISEEMAAEDAEAFLKSKAKAEKIRQQEEDYIEEYCTPEKTQEELEEESRLARYGLVVNKNGHYVDKAEFYRHMCMYCEARDKAKAEGKPKPSPDDYIGLCITKIATHIAQRPNFSGYTYKEEFIGDAIESCIKYIDNFDPRKSNNPFCYFTTVCMYCFLGRIKQEKKQSIIKGALMMQSMDSDFMTVDGDDEFNIEDSMRNHHTFVELAYEQKRKDQASAEEKRLLREQRRMEKMANENNLEFLFK